MGPAVVRIAEKGSETILYKGVTILILNSITHKAQNREDHEAYRKHKQLEGNSFSLKRDKWRTSTLVNALRMAKTRSNLHTGQYAGMFCLTTARDKRWWSHCCSFGSPDISTSFFARQLKKWAVDLPYTVARQWFWMQLVESNNCQGGHCIFNICWSQHQLLHCLV